MQIQNSTILEDKIGLPSENENLLHAETALLREALLRTHLERFLFATKLYKIQKTMEKFSILHKPYNIKK